MPIWQHLVYAPPTAPPPTGIDLLVIGLGVSPWTLWYDNTLTNISAPATVPAARVEAVAFSPDGNLLVIATRTALFRYDLSSGTPTYLGALSSPPAWTRVSQLSFNPTGTRLLVSDPQVSPYLWVYDTSAWTTVTAPTGVLDNAALSWSSLDKIVVGKGSPGLMTLYDPPGMSAAATQPGTQPSVNWLNADFSPDGAYFAAHAILNPSPMRVWQMSSLAAPLASPATMPTASAAASGRSLVWNPASTKYALCDGTGTSIYNVSGTTVSLDTRINYGTNGGLKPFWRADGAKLFLTQASSPRFAVYTVSGWTKDTDPATQPTAGPTSIAANF